MTGDEFEEIVCIADRYMSTLDRYSKEMKFDAWGRIDMLRSKLASKINKSIKGDPYLKVKLEMMEQVGFRWRHKLGEGCGDVFVNMIKANRGDVEAIGRKAGEYLTDMED